MLTLLGFVSPVAAVGLLVALYNLYLKRRETAVQGWLFTTSPSIFVDNGKQEVDVTIKPVGGATVYEVETHVWNYPKLPRDTVPKMDCESEPITATLRYQHDLPGSDAPWIGVTWTDAAGLVVKDEGARINIKTDEYQRWKWFRFSSWIQPWRAPRGEWRAVQTLQPRKRFQIPPPDRATVAPTPVNEASRTA